MRRWIEKSNAVSVGDGFGGFGATCPLCRAGWHNQEPGARAFEPDQEPGQEPAADPETRSVPFPRGVAANEN
jgi:hypothetical protein